MIKLEDLEQAILECQGERNPNAQTCIKLAAYYIIKEHLFDQGQPELDRGYSGDWKEFPGYEYKSDTEFAKIAANTDKNVLMQVVDELMTVLEATNPRLYHAVLRKMLDS